MTEIQKCFIDIIGSVALNMELAEDFKLADLGELYELSKAHDMAHLAAYYLKKNNVIDPDSEIGKAFEKQYRLAQYRVASLQAEYENICYALEDAGIDYIPLKGAVLRSLYPQEWMRVSCDIDILVHKDDLLAAKNALVEGFGYTVSIQGNHDDHVDAPNGFHVELHFKLTERKVPAKPFFDDVWNYVTLAQGHSHQYLMTDEMFYLFHIFHAAVHLKLGGCGVRTFLDTWLLNHKTEFDKAKRVELLKKCKLDKAANFFEELSDHWFSGVPNDSYTLLEDYIFKGGVYGESNHYLADEINNNGNTAKYYFRRIFPKYNNMLLRYPTLRKKPYLLPFYWVKRLVSLFDGSTSDRIKGEIKYVGSGMDEAKTMASIFNKIGV